MRRRWSLPKSCQWSLPDRASPGGSGLRSGTRQFASALGEYFRACKVKPKEYLFLPTRVRPGGEGRPISDKTVWNAVRDAARRAGLTKRIGPHTYRGVERSTLPVANERQVIVPEGRPSLARMKDY
jgi:hypothetical protein